MFPPPRARTIIKRAHNELRGNRGSNNSKHTRERARRRRHVNPTESFSRVAAIFIAPSRDLRGRRRRVVFAAAARKLQKRARVAESGLWRARSLQERVAFALSLNIHVVEVRVYLC